MIAGLIYSSLDDLVDGRVYPDKDKTRACSPSSGAH